MARVMRDDVRFWPILTELASCLCAEITESGLPEPCFCGVLPGEAALDYCNPCDGGGCGMAWVRPITVTQVQSASEQQNTTAGLCAQPLEMTFEVGVARCAPSPTAEGEPPSMADQLDATRLLLADQAAALRAIRCCLPPHGMVTLGEWTGLGPDGGCVGGVWTVSVMEG